jgi:3',5'-cyclic AMP phosphodiesterase CpdA
VNSPTTVTLVHVSDLHLGRDANLAQLAAVERQVPALAPTAIIVSGDLTQRARHGEFVAARRWLDRLAATAPLLAVPGNHDVQWFESPFWILGRERMYVKYRHWINADLTPTLRVPGAVIASALTSHGVCFPSMTPNLNDMAVKGHLPLHEVERVARVFEAVAPGDARVVVLHQNVLRGKISQRMGLSRWKTAQERLAALKPDVILCGHDHEEQAELLGERVVVSTASTLTHRTRGHQPQVFNVVRIGAEAIEVEFWRWAGAAFVAAETATFGRSDVRTSGHWNMEASRRPGVQASDSA